MDEGIWRFFCGIFSSSLGSVHRVDEDARRWSVFAESCGLAALFPASFSSPLGFVLPEDEGWLSSLDLELLPRLSLSVRFNFPGASIPEPPASGR
jgi:hypothetical protein